MSKQDRVAPRTAADIESKYNFGKSFAEVMGFAKDAEKAAGEAKDAAENASNAVGELDNKLDQTEIFNRLTDNGKAQGVYREEDGQIYINASYIKAGELLADLIKTGTIKSADGSVEFDLSNNTIKVYTADRQSWTEISGGDIKCYEIDSSGNPVRSLWIDPRARGATWVVNDGSTGGIVLAANKGPTEIGSSVTETRISGSSVKIGFKTVSWRDNGDGTFTLIGT